MKLFRKIDFLLVVVLLSLSCESPAVDTGQDGTTEVPWLEIWNRSLSWSYMGSIPLVFVHNFEFLRNTWKHKYVIDTTSDSLFAPMDVVLLEHGRWYRLNEKILVMKRDGGFKA